MSHPDGLGKSGCLGRLPTRRATVTVGFVAAFQGFSSDAIEFYSGLAADNRREFWTAHKSVYDTQVRQPMLALLAELEPEFGPGTLFRPHRDTRFSQDKSPYKTYQAAIVGPAPGIGFYVELNADGLLAGGGYHAHDSTQVDRFRKAVDAEDTGSALQAIVATIRDSGLEVEGDQLKTRPRGYAADHPRLELLRYRSLVTVRRFGTPPWLSTPATVDEVRDVWRQVAPLNDWIAANVEPA